MKHHSVSLASALKVAGFKHNVLGGLNKPFRKLNMAVRNVILATILPSEIETSSELFGRSSLTKYSWEPKLGDPKLIELLQGLLSELRDSTVEFSEKNIMTYGSMYQHNLLVDKKFFRNPSGAFMKFDTTLNSTFTEQSDSVVILVSRLSQTIEALNNPVWVSMTDPLEVLLEYQYCLRESAKLKGMMNTEVATAKFGADPFAVKMWKLWSQTVAALTRFNSNTDVNDEI